MCYTHFATILTHSPDRLQNSTRRKRTRGFITGISSGIVTRETMANPMEGMFMQYIILCKLFDLLALGCNVQPQPRTHVLILIDSRMRFKGQFYKSMVHR